MSIPKIIHYCWFGKKPLPASVKKCIASWENKCPDYKIIRWDETNFDIRENEYMSQAYDAGKWAFASDFARLKIVYENGGIYLDTDVEVIKSLNVLTEKYDGFFGYEHGKDLIATGLGFGAKKGDKFVKAMLDRYDGLSFFDKDGKQDETPCPERNTEAVIPLGVDPTKRGQVIDNVCFLKEEVLCPVNFFTGKKKITKETVSIHHYDASWCGNVTKRTLRLKRLIGIKLYSILYGKFLYKSDRWEW